MLNSVQTLGSRSQSKVYEVNKVSSQTLQTVIQNPRTSRDKLLPTIWYRVMFQFRLESQKLKPHFKYILSIRWSEQIIFGPQCVTDLRTILSSMKSFITCIPLSIFFFHLRECELQSNFPLKKFFWLILRFYKVQQIFISQTSPGNCAYTAPLVLTQSKKPTYF